MLGELTLPRPNADTGRIALRWYLRLQYAIALLALAGIALLSAIMLSKTFFLGSDSANDYAHVWYISDQIFHHARLPLHFSNLESGNALTFPYAVVPWTVTALPYALIGDRAVTVTMMLGFGLYGYTAVRARPALRDPRLLCLIYINTFLIEGLVSFQMAFIWACVFFFLFIEAIDHERWPLASVLAILAVSTHPFAGATSVGVYAVYAAVRQRNQIIPVALALAAAAVVLVPFALYIHSAPAVTSTHERDLMATLRWIARYRGLVVALPLLVSACAPAFRALFPVVFLAMALTFAQRIDAKKVNTFGLDRNSHPFYAAFLSSPQFDHGLRYRVLEPNDREDGAYQLIQGGAVLTQEFFDQSQFRRWWNTPEQYACFLGAKHVDVVLLEKDYPLKFSQNEDVRLAEFERAGKAHVIYRDAASRFTAYDVRDARQPASSVASCGL